MADAATRARTKERAREAIRQGRTPSRPVARDVRVVEVSPSIREKAQRYWRGERTPEVRKAHAEYEAVRRKTEPDLTPDEALDGLMKILESIRQELLDPNLVLAKRYADWKMSHVPSTG